MKHLEAIALSLLIGIAWLFPLTIPSALLTIVAAYLLVQLAEKQNRGKNLLYWYTIGLLTITIGFHWLPKTIYAFGGFPKPVAYLIFALFVASAAFQFFVFALLLKLTRKSFLTTIHLATTGSWIAAQFLTPKIFPWELGHPLINIPILCLLYTSPSPRD